MADEMDIRVKEIEQSVNAVEAQLREQIASAESSKRTWLVVGVILVVAVFAYLTYLSGQVKELAAYAEPKQLADMLQLYASQQIPELEKTAIDQAPAVVTHMREQLMKEIPNMRAKAEKGTLSLVDKYAEQLNSKAGQVITEMLEKHKDTLKPLIEAAVAKGNEAELAKAFKDALEDTIGPKMDEALAEYDKVMVALEKKLDRLAMDDKQLTPEEQFEKELIIGILGFLDEEVKKIPEPVLTPKM